MKRIFTSLNRRASSVSGGAAAPSYEESSPEANILKEVSAFCESGGNANNSQSTDYIHLPAIVEAAESSPNAAKEAAYRIRKLLSNPVSAPGHVHYNAIVLMRILIDNPGHTFTRNFDVKFATAIKDLLRQGRDVDVQQFLRETLDWMETDRSWDEDLAIILQMWKKEKVRYSKVHKSLSSQPRPPPRQLSQNYYGSPTRRPRPANVGSSSTLPPPEELSARISEAKNSAKLLLQFVQSTPPAEILDNELMREFSQRCQNASSAIQSYIHAKNPAPDEDTLLTLIESNDELSVALSKHQRAILNARKALGGSNSQSPARSDEIVAELDSSRPVPAPPAPGQDTPQSSPPAASPPAASPPAASPPAGAAPSATGNGAGRYYEYRSEDFQVQNPFGDDAGHNAPGATTATTGHDEPQQHGGAATTAANERWYQQHAERPS